MQRKGFFARLADLWRGFWGVRLASAEASSAEVVYHNAIQRRVEQHDKLRDAVARLVYLRNRVDAQLQARRGDLRVVSAALLRAAGGDDDTTALGLIRKQRHMEAEMARLEGEQQRLAAQAESAKGGLAEVANSIQVLKAERAEMIAREAHARARIDAKAVLEASAVPGADQALENVRESIARLESQADLNGDYAPAGELSMDALRKQAESEDDRQTLAALKHRIGKRLLSDRFTEPGASDATRSEVAS